MIDVITKCDRNRKNKIKKNEKLNECIKIQSVQIIDVEYVNIGVSVL